MNEAPIHLIQRETDAKILIRNQHAAFDGDFLVRPETLRQRKAFQAAAESFLQALDFAEFGLVSLDSDPTHEWNSGYQSWRGLISLRPRQSLVNPSAQ